jgi:hypothetical protein
MLSRDLLPIYLNDHLTGATIGRDLARRAAGSNAGTELGEFLEDLTAQIEADRAQLEEVMARLEVGVDQIKVRAAWVSEKLGRLKLNGRLLEYSPLSRVLELEGLSIAINGKLSLWRTLALVAPREPRIADIDFVQLVDRAEQQLAGVEAHHGPAVEAMLAADAARASGPRPSPGGS